MYHYISKIRCNPFIQNSKSLSSFVLERERRSFKTSRAIFSPKKGVFVTYGRIQVEMDPSIKPVESTSHVNNANRFIDIREDDEALEHPSCPYQTLPKDWVKRFNGWFR